MNVAATWGYFEEYLRSHSGVGIELQTRIVELENKLEAKDLALAETEKNVPSTRTMLSLPKKHWRRP